MKNQHSILLLVLLVSLVNTNSALSDNTTNQSSDLNQPKATSINLTEEASDDRYIVKLGIIADFEFSQLYGAEADNFIVRVMDQVIQTYNNNGLPIYFQLDLILVMANESWSQSVFDAPVTSGETDPTDLLNNLVLFAQNEEFLSDFDMIHLVTGRDFTGSTTGLAFLGSAPGVNSLGVIQGSITLNVLADAISHEMGHNFGALHDGAGNSCASTGYIMAAVSSTTSATQFSTCSVNYINNHLITDWTTTLDSNPPSIVPNDYTTLELGDSLPLWTVNSSYSDYYKVFLNNSLAVTAPWNLRHVISSSVFDKVGTFNVSLQVFDKLGRNSFHSMVVEIVDTTVPFMHVGHKNTEVGDHIEIQVGYSDNFLTMNITDLSPGTLTMTMDGISEVSTWDDTIWFEYNLGNLAAGDHVLVISAADTSSNTYAKTITITVVGEAITGTTTSEVTTSDNEKTENSDEETESSNPSILGTSTVYVLMSSFLPLILLRRKK